MYKFLHIVIMILAVYGCKKPANFASVNDTTTRTLPSGGTNYYIDAASGNDTNAGTSPAKAWKTLAKINSSSFMPGDSILLKSNNSWTGQLYPKGSGSATAPVVISSYGSGAKPVINGNGLQGGTVYLKNQSNWIIRNLEVTNTAAARDNIYRWGIFAENNSGGTMSNIQILNNYVHDVTGSFRWVTGYIDPHMNGGIGLNVTGSAGTDNFDGVLIQDNLVMNVGRTGIVVWDNVWNGTGFSSVNVKVRKNTVRNIDSDGILTFGCNSALLEYNVADGCGSYVEAGQFNGSCAIWSTRGSNCISQYNEAYNTKALTDNADGQGFDIDMDATNCIVQYNYSHDNAGGFLLIVNAKGQPGVQLGTSGAIVRYNISQNDGTRIINMAGGTAPGTQLYNNTFYTKQGLSTNIIDHSWDLDMTGAWSFKNNIVYNLGNGVYNIPGTAGSIDYNLYYGNHPAGEPADQHKQTGNPSLVNAGSGGTGINTVNGYQLSSSSPAIAAGQVIARNGAIDYWNNPVGYSVPPNLGAHNGGNNGIVSLADYLNDWDPAWSHTGNMIFDATNPAYFNNDNSRASRSDGNTGNIVYHYTGLSTISAIIYEFSTDLSKVKFYTSPDGNSWTLLNTAYTTPVATSGGWFQTTFSSSSPIPGSTNYIKIELSDANNWGTQIGQVTGN